IRSMRILRQIFLYRTLYLLLFPTFILLAIFNLIPFFMAFATSLTRYEVGTPPEFIGLQNYLDFFGDPTLWISFRNMAFLTAFAVMVTIIVPLTVAKLIFSLSFASPRA